MRRPRPTRAEAAAWIARLHRVMTPLERTMIDAVAGRGEHLEDVVAKLGVPFEEGLEALRSALDKTNAAEGGRKAAAEGRLQ